ncbi:hypothetical protein IKG33_01395 [Candidatus Saccharibacteria bacterium]|nr:hypothetical protein [Candidatus Saccharibacteria bacterium]
MNKKYMDFVPKGKKPAKKMASKPVKVARPAVKSEPVKEEKKAPVKKAGLRGYGIYNGEDLKTIKSKKVSGARTVGRIVEKPVEKSVDEGFKIEERKTMKIPQTTFINKEKVVKRPLSKNVYQKKVEKPEKVQTEPVTIISKPEKDKHAGLIIAVIITIILGAAAGTVAFLLLPK